MTFSTADSPTNKRRRPDSLPAVIHLKNYTQSELYELSLRSNAALDLPRCDDIVIPEIDPSVFNESEGSRKQTYSRFHLSPRKPESSTAADPPTPQPDDDPERVEDARIIKLLKDLMHAKKLVPGRTRVERNDSEPQLSTVDELQNVINVPNLVNAVMKRGRGRPRKNVNRLAVNVPIPVNVGKKRGPGRPRKNDNRLAVNVQSGVNVGKKRGRGRPRKIEDRLVVVNVPNAVSVGMKRGRGRPRKYNVLIDGVNVGKKRGRGRPRKYEVLFDAVNVPSVVNVLKKRGRGRPRKLDNSLVVFSPVVETPAVAMLGWIDAATEGVTVDANVGDSEVKEDN